MMVLRTLGTALVAGALLLGAGCKGGSAAAGSGESAPLAKLAVTITSKNGQHLFNVEVARTPEQQQRGLMFRTDIPENGGMIFIPYPANGGPPQEASFWMHNTPSSLDIIFIRPDGTIARIAENTVPYSDDLVPSGEPVNGVLEIRGGRAAELGIAEGDKVGWPGR